MKAVRLVFSVKCAKNMAKKRTQTLTYMAICWLMCTVYYTTQSHGNGDDAFHSLHAAVINQDSSKSSSKKNPNKKQSDKYTKNMTDEMYFA